MNIRPNPSSAYNSASNSLAERAVQSLQNILRKSSDKLNELQLMEICFAINSHISIEGSGSNNERFLGWSVRSCLPNSIDPTLNTKELIERRIERHEHRMTKTRNKNKNKVIYQPGDRVMLQNVRASWIGRLRARGHQMMARWWVTALKQTKDSTQPGICAFSDL